MTEQGKSGKTHWSRESSRYEPTGYLMLKSIEITNFRGIESLRLTDLKRLNVIVGPNGTGKTALLESIFLAGGNSPEIILKTKTFRGREAIELSGDLATVQHGLWGDTFRDPDKREATIQIIDTEGDVRSVKVTKLDSEQIVYGENGARLAHAGMRFEWSAHGAIATSIPEIAPGGLTISSIIPGPGVHFVPSRLNISETETARTFSRLSVEPGGAQLFTDAFYREFKFLRDVSVEAPSGAPALHARMANGRKLPLAMISGGISHLAAIMVRLAANKRSILLIDEIENGFYYDKYESIWRTIFELAMSSDSQVFATSHSLECLTALVRAIPTHADDVAFIRSRMNEDAETEYQQLTGRSLFKALEVGEVR